MVKVVKSDQNGQEWSRVVKSGQEWSRVVKSGQSGQSGPEWSRVVKSGQSGQSEFVHLLRCICIYTA